jgi:tripartite-type tricarboxylate transporter receptor subunit TctC
MIKRAKKSAWICAAALFACSPAWAADDFPSQPIRIEVAAAPGGPLDLVARTISDRLSMSLKQPVIVENKSGAGGNIAADFVSKSQPDGYTLGLLLSTTLTVNPYLTKGLSFNLKPISVLNYSTQVVVVYPTVPAKNIPEFVKWAKKNEPVSYGHAGNGTPAHLAMEYFRLLAGFKTVPIPYRGAAPMATDMLAGQFKAAFGSLSQMLPLVNTGKLRALAVSTAKRSPLAPEIPTIAESGYPGFDLSTDFLLMAPGGTPDDVVAKLYRETKKILELKEVQDVLRPADIWVVASTPKEAADRLKAGSKLWEDVVKRTGMSAN